MINRHLLVSGRVQGVGFRWSTMRVAQDLGLSGWVQNQFDGTVKIEVQGPEKIVHRFIAIIKKGPTSYARVDNCQITSGPLQHYGSFTVR